MKTKFCYTFLVPDSPILWTAISDHSTSICLAWQTPQQIDPKELVESYFVTLSTIQNHFNRTYTGFTPEYPTTVTNFSACFNDVEEGLNYAVSVRAVNAIGMGAASNNITVHTASGL